MFGAPTQEGMRHLLTGGTMWRMTDQAKAVTLWQGTYSLMSSSLESLLGPASAILSLPPPAIGPSSKSPPASLSSHGVAACAAAPYSVIS